MNALCSTSFEAVLENHETVGSPVVGLHCSGATGMQWAGLQNKLGAVRFLAPDLIGTPSRRQWNCAGSFSLSDEAEHVISEIESLGEPANIVGHSYGGALALHVARARPDLVKSLCLYEPTLFAVLASGTPEDKTLKTEINALAQAIQNGLEEDCYDYTAQIFTDFWGGLGAWQALSKERRDAMTDWIEKAPLDFAALLNEPEAERIVVPDMPVTLLLGSETHSHTARIVDLLLGQSKCTAARKLRGADHLGPFTYKSRFEKEVLDHLTRVDECCLQLR